MYLDSSHDIDISVNDIAWFERLRRGRHCKCEFQIIAFAIIY